MATLYITEFQALGQAGLPTNGYGPNGPTQAAQQPPVAADQTVAIAAGSASSAAFNAATVLVRLHTDAICSVLFGLPGATPTALTTSARMVAGQTEYFGVLPGMKVAVIANT